MSRMLEKRNIGDLKVSAIGMGAMTLTQTLEHDPARAVDVVAAALEAGITLFDTADSYGPIGEMGVNELALINALRQIDGALDTVVVATKAGHTRGPNATWWVDGSPAHIAKAARDSLQRLGLESMPLYQHHRPDPKVPYSESMQAFKKLYDEGLVQRVGVSNVDLTQLETAREILGDALVSVQNEYSPAAVGSAAVLERTRATGLAFLAWGPLGGMRQAKSLSAGIPIFNEVAAAHEVSPQQVALAWLLALAPNVIPIPGASRPASVRDSAAAVGLKLGASEIAQLSAAAKAHEQELLATAEREGR